MRLPEFLVNLFPVGWVLKAIEFGVELFRKAVMRKNDQLAVSTAEEALPLWEKDYSLPSDGDVETRRSRIRAAMVGSRTLTREQLRQMAVTLAGADDGVVEEDFPNYAAALTALYHGRTPENITALREAVNRQSPAHLTVEVIPAMGLTTAQSLYLGQHGGIYLHMTSEEGGTTA